MEGRASRISETFARMRESNRKALICYLMAGDPDLDTTFSLVHTVAEAGADMIELGVPFSDPLADGPVIQRASARALSSCTNLTRVLEMVSRLSAETEIPLIMMSYLNPVYRYGVKRFLGDASSSGLRGIIIPDLPMEESRLVSEHLRGLPLDFVPMLAPTSTEQRVRLAAHNVTGFIYCVAVTGVTGPRSGPATEVADLITRVRAITRAPLAAGFGVSTPADAQVYANMADAVVVGSAIVEKIERFGRDSLPAVGDFVAALREGIQ